MKVGGGLSAPLLPHLNAASLCFWESNWKVFSGYICARTNKRSCAYQMHVISKEVSYSDVLSAVLFQEDTFC